MDEKVGELVSANDLNRPATKDEMIDLLTAKVTSLLDELDACKAQKLAVERDLSRLKQHMGLELRP